MNPQTRTISPYFDGVLKLNDTPLENVEILLSTTKDDPQCFHVSHRTATDADGKFSLPSAKQSYSYVPFINYDLDEWTVCAKYNKERYTLYNNNSYGSGSIADSIQLDCDLSKNPLSKLCKQVR